MKLGAKRYVAVGDVVSLILPWSEVCMHMGLAGITMNVRVQVNGAQLLSADGSPHSFPILHGEAGISSDAHGLYVMA